MQSIWLCAPKALKINIYSIIISYIVLYRSIRSGLLILSRTSVLYFFSWSAFSVNHWKKFAKSLILIINLLISPFGSDNFYFIYFEAI